LEDYGALFYSMKGDELNGTWGNNQDPIAAEDQTSDLSDGSTEILNNEPYLYPITI